MIGEHREGQGESRLSAYTPLRHTTYSEIYLAVGHEGRALHTHRDHTARNVLLVSERILISFSIKNVSMRNQTSMKCVNSFFKALAILCLAASSI